MIGLGMGRTSFERVGRAMKVVEPAAHGRALVDGERGLRLLEVEQRDRRGLDNVADFRRARRLRSPMNSVMFQDAASHRNGQALACARDPRGHGGETWRVPPKRDDAQLRNRKLEHFVRLDAPAEVVARLWRDGESGALYARLALRAVPSPFAQWISAAVPRVAQACSSGSKAEGYIPSLRGSG